nr:putative Ig domain-containing protein [uncultured Carboxylicivirga sp.]
MKTRLKVLALGAFFCLMQWNVVFSQVSFGGIPPSFKERIELPSVNSVDVNFNVDRLKAESQLSKTESNNPPCIAKAIPVSYDMESSGDWSTLPDGREMWQLRIKAEDAIAIILSYDDFYIPECGKLYIYSADKSHVIGGYSSSTHPQGGAFSTEMVAGDDIILEYVSTKTRKEILDGNDLDSMPVISIDKLGYVFDNVVVKRFPKSASVNTEIGESSSCMININCTEGDEWQTEKKGVCQMSMYVTNGSAGAGWYVCSGTLINNTAQDLTPYILSAYHCYEGSTEDDFARWQFTFGYESPGCQDEQPLETHTIIGCDVRVADPIDGGSDGLLLELTQDVPLDWDVYYNGWDRRNEVVEGVGVGIHHPAGDIKKISTFRNYDSGTWPGAVTGATGAHWLFSFVETANGHSVTEGGSSGSPLFSSEHLVIGTLTGGNSSCTNLYGNNYYGKLWFHWDHYGDSPQTQMKTWLDPLDLGVMTLAGTSVNPTSPRIACETKSLELEGSSVLSQPGAEQTIVVEGFNLEEDITASVEGEFEVSSDNISWGTQVNLVPEGGKLYIRFLPTTIGHQTGQIALTNPLASTIYVNLSASSCPVITFDYDKLPTASINEDYSFAIEVSNNSTEVVNYEITNGALPEGLQFESTSGLIYGTPVESGSFPFSVLVTDENGCFASADYEVYVICNIVSDFPFNENFEFGFPLCWDQSYQTGSVKWNTVQEDFNTVQYPSYSYEGEFYMAFTSMSPDGNSTILTTPQLNLEGLNNPVLSFAHAQPKWDFDQDVMEVYYKTSALGEWKQLASYTDNIPDWTVEHIQLPEASSEYYVGFKATSYFGRGVMIDDLTVGSPLIEVTSQLLSTNDFVLENDLLITEVTYTGTDLAEDITVSSEQPFSLSADKIDWSTQLTIPAVGGVVYISYDNQEPIINSNQIIASSTSVINTIVVEDVSTGIDDVDNDDINVINPFSEELFIQWNAAFDAVEVVDMSGVTVYSASNLVNSNSLRIASSDWASGVYFIRLTGANYAETVKVIKK